MSDTDSTAKEISGVLRSKLPTIRVIESAVNQGGSVAEVRLKNDVRYLPIFDNVGSISSVQVR
jgi:hypothetical protein